MNVLYIGRVSVTTLMVSILSQTCLAGWFSNPACPSVSEVQSVALTNNPYREDSILVYDSVPVTSNERIWVVSLAANDYDEANLRVANIVKLRYENATSGNAYYFCHYVSTKSNYYILARSYY